jgi:poly(3-hydroxyalkanoate) depolymerase
MNKPYLRLVADRDAPSTKPAAAKRKSGDRPLTIAFETVGRQKLRVAKWTGKGAGRPLLFFNGIGVNFELAAPLAAALPDRDLITFDMPGIGLSPGPRLPYRPWWAAHAAAKILDRLGYTDKIDVLGLSWGGAVAQQFAFQNGHRVNRIALAATSPGAIMVPGDLGLWSRLLDPRGFFDVEALGKGFAGLLGEGDGLPKGLASKFRLPLTTGYAAQIAAVTGWTSLPFLPFLKMPALVLSGARDRVVPPVNSRILAALIPKGRLHIVENAGHFFLVTRLDKVAPVLTEFFDEDRLDRIRMKALPSG